MMQKFMIWMVLTAIHCIGLNFSFHRFQLHSSSCISPLNSTSSFTFLQPVLDNPLSILSFPHHSVTIRDWSPRDTRTQPKEETLYDHLCDQIMIGVKLRAKMWTIEEERKRRRETVHTLLRYGLVSQHNYNMNPPPTWKHDVTRLFPFRMD